MFTVYNFINTNGKVTVTDKNANLKAHFYSGNLAIEFLKDRPKLFIKGDRGNGKYDLFRCLDEDGNLRPEGYKYTLSELESQGFEGTDASLETSLFEYGIAVHESEDGSITVIYGTSKNVNASRTHVTAEHTNFVETYFDSRYEVFELFDEDWFSFEDFASFCDLESKAQAQQMHLASLLHSMKQYHGSPNIFGSTTQAEFFEIYG